MGSAHFDKSMLKRFLSATTATVALFVGIAGFFFDWYGELGWVGIFIAIATLASFAAAAGALYYWRGRRKRWQEVNDMVNSHERRLEGLEYLYASTVANDRTARTDLATYAETLDMMIPEGEAQTQEEIHETYWIGINDEADRVERKHVTRALNGRAVPWYTFRIGSVSSTDAVRSFKDCDAVIKATGREAVLLPLRQAENELRGIVAFFPPIREEPQPWTLEYRWPGLWHSLRLKGLDRHVFTVANEAIVEVLTQTFVFPSGLSGTLVEAPSGGTVTKGHTEGGLQYLAWREEQVAVGRYPFRLRMDETR